jgi:transposase-like protein
MPTVTQDPLSGRYLSFEEREEIAVLRAGGCGMREIARRLGRSPSTISGAASHALPAAATAPRPRNGMRERASAEARRLAIHVELRRSCSRARGAGPPPDGATVLARSQGMEGPQQPRRQDRRWASARPEQISNRLA